MRGKYSIGALALAAAAAAAADPCPAALTAVARDVGALRAVAAPFSPPCRLIPAAALAGALDAKLRRDLPLPPELFLEALARLGLIEAVPAGGLYERLLAFYASQVLGFYEPESDEMVLVDVAGPGAAAARLVWAHELAHAAQEHRFALPSRLLGMRRDGDAQRAASAIAEGEAMLVMFFVVGAAEGGADPLETARVAMRAQAETFAAPPGVPDYFVQDLLFPYTTGFEAVVTAYRGGGWAAVDGLLARPPASTAALLHPTLAPPGAPLGDAELPPVPAGWDEVLTDTLGEWGLRYWLKRPLGRERAATLAAGWDADRLRLVRDRSRSGRWAMAWRLRCRSAAAAAALESALRAHLPVVLAALEGPPQLAWAATDRALEVRAGWPAPNGEGATVGGRE